MDEVKPSEIVEIVPQFFYDLISRVLPGGFALFTVSWATGKPLGAALSGPFSGAPALQDSAFALALVFFATSYLVGQLLAPITDLYERKVLAVVSRPSFNYLRAIFGGEEGYPEWVIKTLAGEALSTGKESRDLSDQECRTYLFLCYDSLRVVLPEVGARSAKIRAEYRMHEALAMAGALGCVMHLLSVVLNWRAISPAFLATSLSILVATSWGATRTYRVFQKSVFHNYASWRRAGLEGRDEPEKDRIAGPPNTLERTREG